jgi:hypothetical protein
MNRKFRRNLSQNSDTIAKGAAMNHDIEVKLGSTILTRLNAVRMSEAERQVAVDAMRGATTLVDGFVWAAKKIEQMGERLFLKPSLKPSLKH